MSKKQNKRVTLKSGLKQIMSQTMASLILPTAVISLPSSAHIQLGNVLMPALAPNCNIAIHDPAGAAGFYFSQDCKVAYVLPASSGVVKVESVATSTNLALCAPFREAMARNQRTGARIEKIQEMLTAENISNETRTKLMEVEKSLLESMKEQMNLFEGVPAATLQISFRRPSSTDLIAKYVLQNHNVVADYGLKFLSAPVHQSSIYFSSILANKTKIRLNPVLLASIPGLRETQDGKYEGTGAVISNGSVSGQLVLGLSGICQSAEAIQAAKEMKADQSLVAHMVANFDYTVPVYANVGYTASLDVQQALHKFVQAHQKRTPTTFEEIAEIMSSGEVGSAYQFTLTNLIPGEKIDLAKTITLSGEVRDRMVKTITDAFQDKGFLEIDETKGIPEAGTPGYEEIVQTRKECRNRNVGAFRRCRNVPVVVKIAQTTQASRLNELLQLKETHLVDSVSQNTVVLKTHTGSFFPSENQSRN